MTNVCKANMARAKHQAKNAKEQKQANHGEIQKQNQILSQANICEICFTQFASSCKLAMLNKHIEEKHDNKKTFEECFPKYQQVQDMVKEMTCNNKPKK